MVLHAFPEPELEALWRGLLARVETPSHYTSPEYFREPYFEGKRAFAILVLKPGSMDAVLTGFHNGSDVSCGLPTRPQLQVAPDAPLEEVGKALASGLSIESAGAATISVYSWSDSLLNGLLSFRYRMRQVGAVPVLDLTLGAAELLKQCNGKRRNCIRFGMKSDLDVSEWQNETEFAAFYEIYKAWCEEKKVPAYSYDLEKHALADTRGNRRLLLARHGGDVIAGSVFRFYPCGLMEYSRNSSLPERQSLKPNDLLVWRAVEWAAASGFQKMSMGGSHRFLREFGGQLQPVYRYRLDRSFLRRHDRKEAWTERAGELVKRLPPEWETRLRKLVGKEIPAGW